LVLESEKARGAVPKLKTHKASAKRFKITRTGKVMGPKGSVSHHRLKKSGWVRRQIEETFPLAKGDARRVKKLLPYA